jgi:hypothetical protein
MFYALRRCDQDRQRDFRQDRLAIRPKFAFAERPGRQLREKNLIFLPIFKRAPEWSGEPV